MVMGMECVPELKINSAQIRGLDQEHWSVSTLEVITVRAGGIRSAAVFSAEVRRKPTDIFALHEAVFDGTTKTLAGLLLVTVVASTVKETVANFNSVVNHLEADINERSQSMVPARLTSAQVALGI